jgi:hypothetical protein
VVGSDVRDQEAREGRQEDTERERLGPADLVTRYSRYGSWCNNVYLCAADVAARTAEGPSAAR